MKTRFLHLILVATVAGGVSTACGDDDDSSGATGGASHQGGKTGTGGTGHGGAGHGGVGHGGITSTGGVGEGGSSGAPEGGSAGAPTSNGGTNPGAGGTTTGAGGSSAGRGGITGNGGTSSGGNGTGGITMGGAGGAGAGGGPEGGAGGEGGSADPVVKRGEYLVLTVAQCQSCHTDTQNGTGVLAGNANFRTGGALVPTPNLTPDVATGLGDWTDEQIKHAFRDGIDDEGRQLSPGMPYWLYHNLTDADADAIVAYLRSIKPIAHDVPTTSVVSTAVTPLAPSAFPSTSLTSGEEFESAQHGKYLLTSAARCVGCHSVSTNGVPAPAFSGRPPTTSGLVYPVNLTPDATGTAGWTADDLATVLLTYTHKGTSVPLCNMPRFTGLTPADALAIGRYLTTIPAVRNTAASLADLPACPAQ